MSRIATIAPGTAQPAVEEIFREIEQAFGRVPNLFRTYAWHPPLLEANWHKVQRVMLAGALSRKAKEAIALLVSRDNGCQYCVAAHTGALRAIGVGDAEIARIETDLERADIPPRERALIGFARKANSSPHRIDDTEVAALHAAGATDADIVEALGVMELFAGFNRFLDALEVPLG